MKKGCFAVVVAVLASVAAASGQSTAADRYLISAKAGGVNIVSGQASIERKSGGQASLLRQDSIEDGDIVTTADGAYAEVLLNPGSYLRVAPNSRFRFASTSLDDLRIEILSGSAIFEVNAPNGFAMSVATPAVNLMFDRTGIYRVNLDPPPGAVEVLKGKTVVGNTEIKEGYLLGFSPGATPAKFDRKDLDAFAIWSQDRAKDLALATRSVQANAFNNSVSSYSSFYLPSGYYGSDGFWLWDSFSSRGFYYPFNHHHHSPYGHDLCGWGHHPHWEPRTIDANNAVGHQKPPHSVPPTTGGSTRNSGNSAHGSHDRRADGSHDQNDSNRTGSRGRGASSTAGGGSSSGGSGASGAHGNGGSHSTGGSGGSRGGGSGSSGSSSGGGGSRWSGGTGGSRGGSSSGAGGGSSSGSTGGGGSRSSGSAGSSSGGSAGGSRSSGGSGPAQSSGSSGGHSSGSSGSSKPSTPSKPDQ